MATNIMIGIGGSGAKVVEATVHCLAAGLGPDAVQIGFVDQDKSNGNVARAIQTIETLQQARQHWRAPAGGHRIADGSLLRSDLPLLNPVLWTPYQREQTNLFQALEVLDTDRPAFDLLFMPNETEQKLVLDIGFQAKAHVGSAAIASAIESDTGPFWKFIREQVGNAEGGTPVNIVLAGSAFGGSGAAGLPTIARLLRRAFNGGNVRVGGLLMLPYFKFSDPALATAAKFKELLPQTRGALRYYDNLVQQEERVFDQLYLVGWNRYFDLGYSQPGAGKQKNPALVPELLAALAACRFLADARPEPPQQTELFVSTRSSETALRWADMPDCGGATADAAFTALGRQIRFALAWKHWHPFLRKSDQVWRSRYSSYGWYRRHGLSELDRKGTGITEALDSMSGMVDSLLKWAATIQAYWTRQEGMNEPGRPEGTGDGFGLWRVTDPDLLTVNFDNPTEPITLRDSIDEKTFGRLFATAITARTDADHLPSGDWMLDQLHRRGPAKDAKGLGGIAGAIHQLSGVSAATGTGA